MSSLTTASHRALHVPHHFKNTLVCALIGGFLGACSAPRTSSGEPTPDAALPATATAQAASATPAQGDVAPQEAGSPARQGYAPPEPQPEQDCTAFDDVWLCASVTQGYLLYEATFLDANGQHTSRTLISEMAYGRAFCVTQGAYSVEPGEPMWVAGQEGRVLQVPVTRETVTFDPSNSKIIEEEPCEAAERGLLTVTTSREVLRFPLR